MVEIITVWLAMIITLLFASSEIPKATEAESEHKSNAEHMY